MREDGCRIGEARTLRQKALAGIVVLAGMAAVPQADAEKGRAAVAFVVNPQNEASELTSSQLRRIYLGDETRWGGKTRITILLLPSGRDERRILFDRLLKMSDDDFVRHWIAKVFQGEATSGPKTAASPSSMEKLVTGLPGAIGFLKVDEITPGAPLRVLRIDGKAPGDPGYPFAP